MTKRRSRDFRSPEVGISAIGSVHFVLINIAYWVNDHTCTSYLMICQVTQSCTCSKDEVVYSSIDPMQKMA